MYFLVNAIVSKNFKPCSCIGHMMKRVLDNVSCDPKVKVK